MRTTFQGRWIAAFVSAALAAAPAGASAQAAHPPGAEVVARARGHFSRGVKLYEEDDFRAALIEFSRAYDLAPNWAVLYNVGQAHYQLRDYANALRTLERYVREGGDQIAKDRRAQVDRELDELRGRVAHVTVTTNVRDAELALDDAPLGKGALGEPLLIGAGRHKLTASKIGYAPTTKVVDIAGGDNLAIGLDLEEEPHEVAPSEGPGYAPAAVAAIVGVAGIAVGSVFGVAAMGNRSSLGRACDPQTKVCPPAAQGDMDAYSRNGVISTVGFGVGVAGLVVGTYFFFQERSKDQKSATVTPWVGVGSAGVVGTF